MISAQARLAAVAWYGYSAYSGGCKPLYYSAVQRGYSGYSATCSAAARRS